MPTHSKKLIQFKNKLEQELAHVAQEIDRLKEEMQTLKDSETNQGPVSGKGAPDQHLKRLEELLIIQRDHKARLNAEILRISDRNPGLLRPEFD